MKLQPSHQKASQAALSKLGIEATGRIPALGIVVSTTEPNLSRPEVQRAVVYSVPNHVRKLELFDTKIRRADSKTFTPKDPEAELLWGMTAIRAHEAWAISMGTDEVDRFHANAGITVTKQWFDGCDCALIIVGTEDGDCSPSDFARRVAQ